MNIEFLMIGNELLIGKIKDTNSNWMAKRVTKYGHQLKRITTIGDDLVEISNTLSEILSREPDLIVTSGGLGPTFDDMTLQAVALGLNRELELDSHAYGSIKKAYEAASKRGILKFDGMTKEQEKMAYLPSGATPLPNVRGTAPGVKIQEKKTTIFCLPGVPAEMEAMFNNLISPILKAQKGKFIEKGFIFCGIGESQIAPFITEIGKRYPQLWLKTHPRIGISVEVELSITCFNVENGEEVVDKAIMEVEEIVRKLNGTIKS